MPIRPENLARYPKNWKEIRASILARAGNRCEGSPEFPDCRVINGALGARLRDGSWGNAHPRGKTMLRWEWPKPGDVWWCGDKLGEAELLRVIKIVLTIAHLDHTPENCEPENLKAMCQRCHLNYDKHHHAETAYATRKKMANTVDMFEQTCPTPPSC